MRWAPCWKGLRVLEDACAHCRSAVGCRASSTPTTCFRRRSCVLIRQSAAFEARRRRSSWHGCGVFWHTCWPIRSADTTAPKGAIRNSNEHWNSSSSDPRSGPSGARGADEQSQPASSPPRAGGAAWPRRWSGCPTLRARFCCSGTSRTSASPRLRSRMDRTLDGVKNLWIRALARLRREVAFRL